MQPLETIYSNVLKAKEKCLCYNISEKKKDTKLTINRDLYFAENQIHIQI